MLKRNVEVSEDRRITFRIGINQGDVIIDGEDIHGDGVNLAARLQEVATPGGISISRRVLEDVRDRLEAPFENIGDQTLKNIARPIEVWRWAPDGKPAAHSATAASQLPLPDKPSIAVLPFDNMSGDPEQEYFSDGMTEDIITALSRLRWLFVIARNSSFTYKGRAVDVKQVGREMGVRYVLEGSVRKAGNRLRVTAQLIEAESGNHIWAERYDRELAGIFDLQDELVEAISSNVNAELSRSERILAHNKSIKDLEAWELYQRGWWHFYRRTELDHNEAWRFFGLAKERAPEFANTLAALAFLGVTDVINDRSEDWDATLNQCLLDGKQAVSLDDRDSFNQYALGRVYLRLGDRDRAISVMKESIALNPNSPLGHYGLGQALLWSGRATETIPLVSLAIRLSPRDPFALGIYSVRSSAYHMIGEFDLAITDAITANRMNEAWFWPYLNLASLYAALDQLEEARAACEEAIIRNPKLTAAHVRTLLQYRHPPQVDKFLADLKRAGLPE